MSLLTLTQVDGVTVFVASNQVVAIRQDAANPTTRCYVTMQGIETPVYVQSFWATLVVTVDAELSNQYVELLTTGEQVSLSLDYVYQLRPDPSAPLSRTMVVMGAQGTPFMVSALASVLAAAINAYNTFGVPTVSGVYTPTGTIVTNLDSVTPGVFRYLRVGDVVYVGGTVSVNPTAASPIEFGLSLPFASALVAIDDLSGQANTSSISGVVQSDATHDRADVLVGANTATTSYSLRVSFSYRVL